MAVVAVVVTVVVMTATGGVVWTAPRLAALRPRPAVIAPTLPLGTDR